jgi:hypothetical protein
MPMIKRFGLPSGTVFSLCGADAAAAGCIPEAAGASNPPDSPAAGTASHGLSPAGTMLDVPAMSETFSLPPLAVIFGAGTRHNANVVTLVAPVIGLALELACLHTFIVTGFDGLRHVPRVARPGLPGKHAA